MDLVPESGSRICAKPLESVLEGSTVGLKGKEKERGKLAGQAAGARFWVRSLVPEHKAESNCTPGCAQPVSGPTGSCAHGRWKPGWAAAGQGKARRGRGCWPGGRRDGGVRTDGQELSRKGCRRPGAPHWAWVPTLLELAPVTAYLALVGT